MNPCPQRASEPTWPNAAFSEVTTTGQNLKLHLLMICLLKSSQFSANPGHAVRVVLSVLEPS